MVFFEYIKDVCGEEIAITIEGLETLKIPLSLVYPNMDLAVIHREDRRLQHSGAPQIRRSLVTFENEWFDFESTSSLSQAGQIQGKAALRSVGTLYRNWPNHLDHKKRVLYLRDGAELTKKDLFALHLFAQGWPQSAMAKKMFVSVKAVEKRLAKIKDILEEMRLTADDTCSERDNYTLQGHLMFFELIPFLLAEEDWFNLKPYFMTTTIS